MFGVKMMILFICIALFIYICSKIAKISYLIITEPTNLSYKDLRSRIIVKTRLLKIGIKL